MRDMWGLAKENGPQILKTTAKAVAFIGFLSICAANWLSGSGFDQGTLTRLAASTTRGDDPVTTGSIARQASQTKLDPCAVPRKP